LLEPNQFEVKEKTLSLKINLAISLLAYLINASYSPALAIDSRQAEITSIELQLKKDIDADKTSELEPVKRQLDALIATKGEAQLYLLRADVKYRMYDLKGALSDYDQAISLQPKSTKAYMQRGTANCVGENYEAALNDFNTAISLGETSADAYRNRAGAEEQLGKKEEAIADLTKALSLEKDKERQWQEKLMRGRCYFATKQFEQAIKDTSAVIAVAQLPEDAAVDAYKVRGSSLFFSAKYPEAVTDLTAALKGLDGKSKAGCLVLRSMSYLKLNDKAKAEADMEEAKSLGFPQRKTQ
jgi:tetratricopeptide (TPR) repeat protein